MVQSLWRTVWRFLKIKIELLCTPASPLLGIYLFTVAKIGKQPKCSLTEKWIKKMWHIYIQWNISQPIKENEIMPFDGPRDCHTE